MTTDEKNGFWDEGRPRLLKALRESEAEEIAKLEAEVEGADAARRAELEEEIRRVRASYKKRRRESEQGLFLADKSAGDDDGGETYRWEAVRGAPGDSESR